MSSTERFRGDDEGRGVVTDSRDFAAWPPSFNEALFTPFWGSLHAPALAPGVTSWSLVSLWSQMLRKRLGGACATLPEFRWWGTAGRKREWTKIASSVKPIKGSFSLSLSRARSRASASMVPLAFFKSATTDLAA